ncbi:uncharacterized protein LOC122531552 [Frieseomelitta varia]|uniref:uncharacterized protein LOC122531552 n=1 Tax=Frieseomelitta varia TaxID=561572 RepID=UPI001CB67FF6|nr:uncharacterized protein LOC122531552 [Frieseomelitta varia]
MTRFLELNNNYSQHKIYTDGSKTDIGTGYAIIAEKTKKKTQNLPSSLFIFTAETYAILEAVKYTHSNNEAQIVIYTDSMSVTKSLTKSYNQDNQLISTIQELNHNQPNINATVIWIPAHQGIEGNEKVDAAAKEATVSSLINNRNHLPIPCDDQIIHCKKVAKNEWNNTWKTTKSTQLHKSIQDFHQQERRNDYLTPKNWSYQADT